MNVAEQSIPSSNPPRRIPFTVRFTPQFINRMWDRIRRSTPVRAHVAGLLFGRSEPDTVEVQVFRSFPDGDVNAHLPPDALLIAALLDAARKDPQVASLQLLGWYTFRPTGGLHESDVAFHNYHFRHPNEIALIVRPEQHPDVLFEVYSKSGMSLLSETEHRWGSLRLATNTAVAGPVDVAMRAKIGDEFYLRAYEVGKTLDKAQRREYWSYALELTGATVRSFFRPKLKPAQSQDDGILKLSAGPASPQARLEAPSDPMMGAPRARGAGMSAKEPGASGLPALRRMAPQELTPLPVPYPSRYGERSLPSQAGLEHLNAIRAGDPPPVPVVIRQPGRALPWFSSFVIAGIAAGATFAVYYHAQSSDGQMPGFLRAIFPETGLGLRVEGQGDRVLLTWNRHNAVVSSASGGVLHIDDGAQHRDIRLDPAQIANGAVLYRPASDDVNFRLEVSGRSGNSIVDTMRVLDGGRAAPLEVKSPPDVSGPAAAPKAPGNSSTTVIAAPDQRAGRGTPNRTSPPNLAAAKNKASEASTPAELAAPKASDAEPDTTGRSDSGLTPNGTANKLAESRPPAASPPSSNEALTPSDTSKLNSWEDTLPSGPVEPNPVHPAANIPAPITAEEQASFVPPKPRKQVLPDLRSFGINSIASASQVEVNVRVNKRGRVSEANIINRGAQVPPNLAHAAMDAAKQWTFEPATLHGKNVTSDHTIVFEFRPSSH